MKKEGGVTCLGWRGGYSGWEERRRGKREGGACLKTDAKQGVEFEREIVAAVAESVDLGLVGGDCGWDGLLGFAVEELAEVEGSVEVVFM